MGEKYKERNRLRILKNAHQRVWNYIKMGRSKDLWGASNVCLKLSGILRVWSDEELGREREEQRLIKKSK